VFTGHDLEHSGLFLEGLADAERATQTSGRNALHRLDKFKITTEAGHTRAPRCRAAGR
jgi:hypothetical protein